MSELVPQNKIDGIKALGAEVRLIGTNQDEAQVEADRLSIEEGMTSYHHLITLMSSRVKERSDLRFTNRYQRSILLLFRYRVED